MRNPLPERAFEAPFDVTVIGAGINGVGIARDASLRGLSDLLVDKQETLADMLQRRTMVG